MHACIPYHSMEIRTVCFLIYAYIYTYIHTYIHTYIPYHPIHTYIRTISSQGNRTVYFLLSKTASTTRPLYHLPSGGSPGSLYSISTSRLYIFMYVCLYVCFYVCVHIYIYIYIHICIYLIKIKIHDKALIPSSFGGVPRVSV